MTSWQEVLHHPVLQLRGHSLDLLELLLGGLYAPAGGYCLPGRKPASWPAEPTLRVPAATARAALARDGLLLADPDGTPLARLAVDGTAAGAVEEDVYVSGTLVPLQPAEHGPFRRVRLTAPLAAQEVRGGDRAPLVVAAFAGIPSLEQLTRALVSARGGNLVLLAVADSDTARQEGTALLIESLEAVAAHVPGGRVRLLVVPAGDAARLLARLGADVFLDFTPGPQGGSPAAAGTGNSDGRGSPAGATRTRGLVVLFTGLSGSGKSTLAREVAERLQRADGRHTELLDGDDVRTLLSSGLGFSRADRELNVRRIGWVAARVAEAGGIALCAPIAPFESSRREVRAMASASSDFLLVHVSTPLAVCEERDRKGLYAKARAGLIPEFTGISSPYEEPGDADVVVDLAQTDVAEAAARLLDAVRRLGGRNPADAG
ncbi:adenylyl-sulfate kinase [Arthrobacter sp. MSA 4-2]|uniref:adenylyl-sulfate kinase n=1 Tax=Arthrobacter sp. MSA 4-2 TaxID=2794349 RepID=UPI0018E7933E|nr:adenylyl-sulfate kinase [Arthrobacter sp. MSA 4-2]MBJ2119698.1 adenylyl-sulfate kinase [Arthrobacter sp. MSA 4-2]